MTTRPVAALAAAALIASAPAAAHAAPVLDPLKPCYVSVGVNPSTGAAITEEIEVSGSGFTPNALVEVQVDGVTAATDRPVAADGRVSETVKAPLQDRGEREFAVTVTEQANAAQTASAATRVTALAVSVQPRRARPTSRVTFRGRGFTNLRRPVWAHYVKGRRERRVVRLAARPRGACGTFQVRRRQFPFRPSTGTWRLQIDQQKRYSARPRSVFVRLEVFVKRVIGG